MKFRFFLTFLYMTLCASSYASYDPIAVKEAKDNFALAFSKCGTVNLGSRVDIHKAIIAAYLLKPGDLALDLGSHLGDYSLYYRQLVGDNGYVIAYEASPPIFAALKNRLQQFHNIILKNKAISNTSGKKVLMKIYPNDIGPQCCTVEQALWFEERMSGNTMIIEVETEKLDDLLQENIPRIPFIKIDVEGHEHAVFEGATQLLLTHKPLVIFEYGYAEGVWETNTIQQMEEMGYVCYDCNTDQRVFTGYNVIVTDLLAIPKEREQEITELLPYLHY